MLLNNTDFHIEIPSQYTPLDIFHDISSTQTNDSVYLRRYKVISDADNYTRCW